MVDLNVDKYKCPFCDRWHVKGSPEFVAHFPNDREQKILLDKKVKKEDDGSCVSCGKKAVDGKSMCEKCSEYWLAERAKNKPHYAYENPHSLREPPVDNTRWKMRKSDGSTCGRCKGAGEIQKPNESTVEVCEVCHGKGKIKKSFSERIESLEKSYRDPNVRIGQRDERSEKDEAEDRERRARAAAALTGRNAWPQPKKEDKIEKGRVYLSPGQSAPNGVQTFKGEKGGTYYETQPNGERNYPLPGTQRKPFKGIDAKKLEEIGEYINDALNQTNGIFTVNEMRRIGRKKYGDIIDDIPARDLKQSVMQWENQ